MYPASAAWGGGVAPVEPLEVEPVVAPPDEVAVAAVALLTEAPFADVPDKEAPVEEVPLTDAPVEAALLAALDAEAVPLVRVLEVAPSPQPMSPRTTMQPRLAEMVRDTQSPCIETSFADVARTAVQRLSIRWQGISTSTARHRAIRRTAQF